MAEKGARGWRVILVIEKVNNMTMAKTRLSKQLQKRIKRCDTALTPYTCLASLVALRNLGPQRSHQSTIQFCIELLPGQRPLSSKFMFCSSDDRSVTCEGGGVEAKSRGKAVDG